ncbi:DUF1893 domain-containing protein [Atopobium sp. oral taxon 416]|uniref:DUF1893 domain-containing protein n=1 Tax=Atopobium sp. oral taxon 416 TaxID=712157 RepID=UPI001BA56F88|nr:DUF1893 domain-containing protein [Atopobium sp. oral taxon 416]QUC02089.1 DUF1893 domain-containing protein [Atopobium sp. oral taxon 416]
MGTTDNQDLKQAIQILHSAGVSCVLVKGDDVVKSDRPGVAPLLQLLYSGKSYEGYSAADKIAGKAASMLYIDLKVKAIHSDVMGEGGKQILADYQVDATYDTLVEEIRNRDGTDVCPMDKAVRDLRDPAQAPAVLKATIQALKAKKN